MAKRNTKVRTTKKMKRIKAPVSGFEFDYKNYEALRKYLSDRAKILGRKRTGLSPKQQRHLTVAIKRARHLGLLPFQAHV